MKLYQKSIIITIMLLIFLLLFPCTEARANGISDIEEFNNLSGDAKYLGDSYRDNYSFDIEETGLLDSGKAMVNDIANMLFYAIKTIAYIVVAIFYYAMDLDIGKLLEPFINGIQKSLKEGIFDPLFILAFCGTAILIIKKLFQRDAMGLLSEFIKVIVILILASFVVTDSGSALSYATKITKSISINALTNVNEGKSGSSFSADAAGVLWKGMVHDPWVTMEFGFTSGGKTASDQTIKAFLSTKPDSKERAKLVKEYMDANPDANNFNKGKGGERVAFAFVYLFLFLFKAAVFLLVALIQLAFQALAVFILLLAPIVLLLALIPGYEMNVISIWLKKLLETQMGILLITFMIGLLVKFDSVLYALSGQLGWFIVLIIQVAVSVTIFLQRDKILNLFSNIQKNMNNPGYFKNQLRRSGNLYEGIEKGRDKLMQFYDNHRPVNREDSINAYDQENKSSGSKNSAATSGNSKPIERPSIQSTPPDPSGPPNPPDPSGAPPVQRRVIRTDLNSDPADPVEIDRPRPILKEAASGDTNNKVIYLREYISSERNNGRNRSGHDIDMNGMPARSTREGIAIRVKEIDIERPTIDTEVKSTPLLDQKPQRMQIEASETPSERPRTNTDEQSDSQPAQRPQRGQIEASETPSERPRTNADVQSDPQLTQRLQRGQIEASEMPSERPRANADVQSDPQLAQQPQRRQIEAPETPSERPRTNADVQSDPQLAQQPQRRQIEAPEMPSERPRTNADVQSDPQLALQAQETRIKSSRSTLDRVEYEKNNLNRGGNKTERRIPKTVNNNPSEKTGTNE